jgi:pyridoxamine 5'-phosphate oxidase family protein
LVEHTTENRGVGSSILPLAIHDSGETAYASPSGLTRFDSAPPHSLAVAVSVFTPVEREYMVGGRQLGRIATVGVDGTPHVVPVGWIYNAARDTIDVGGRELQRTKKFRDVARTGRVAIVIDDLESVDPWRPRGIEVRGRGEAIALPTPLIRVHPERIITWGLAGGESARTVARS